jgi:hypothetical protein
LICVGASEERARKVYALRCLRGVERQVGSTRGTRWPEGSSAGRMVARKGRQSCGPEPLQASGSRPESAHAVCGGSPQNRQVTWLSHKTKARITTDGDGIRAQRESLMPRTHGGITGLASGGRGLQRRRGRAMKRSATLPICP